ncbi:MAG: hypothetical protein R3D88_04475 [Alphaproteobacteria bacterium]|nr:hypothetical protein [Alphaproteobacteria bacterium]
MNIDPSAKWNLVALTELFDVSVTCKHWRDKTIEPSYQYVCEITVEGIIKGQPIMVASSFATHGNFQAQRQAAFNAVGILKGMGIPDTDFGKVKDSVSYPKKVGLLQACGFLMG